MDTLVVIIRLIVATILGLMVGWEREYFGKAAGARTFALVTTGSALFTMISSGFGDLSASRIASNVVVGIGFIGAGSIIHHREHTIGLTTAAGLWVAAAIGMAVGIGWYTVAVFTALSTITVFYFLGRLHRYEPNAQANDAHDRPIG